MVKATRFDAAPSQSGIDIQDPRWRKWFQDIWSYVNALVMPQVSSVAVTASPMTWQYVGAAQASLIALGAGVTKVEFSRDNTTYFQVSLVAGMFSVSQGDYLRITYGAAPTLTLVPR